MEYKTLADVPSVTLDEFRPYYEKHFSETKCWACGMGSWILMTVDGEGRATVSFTRSPQRKDGAPAYHMPFFTLECANCHTLWRISARGVLGALRGEPGGEDGPAT